MGLFGFGKKGKVVDLSKKYHEEKAFNESKIKPSLNFQNPGNAFLQNPAENPIIANEFTINGNESVEERRRKLAKRIMDMSSKIDELSNQVFLLQQRIDVLEMRNRAEETPKQETQNNSG